MPGTCTYTSVEHVPGHRDMPSTSTVTAPPQPSTEPKNVPSASPQPKYRTTLVKTLSHILPSDSTLCQFDLLRHNVKKQHRNSHNNTRLANLSQQLKQTLLAKHKELSQVVNMWTKEEKELGVVLTNNRPEHIQHAAHKLNLIRKVLAHKWKPNIDI